MEKIKIDVTKCKGCHYCIQFCPTGAISASHDSNSKGYRVISVNQEKCVQCGSCYRICPDYVFEIE